MKAIQILALSLFLMAAPAFAQSKPNTKSEDAKPSVSYNLAFCSDGFGLANFELKKDKDKETFTMLYDVAPDETGLKLEKAEKQVSIVISEDAVQPDTNLRELQGGTVWNDQQYDVDEIIIDNRMAGFTILNGQFDDFTFGEEGSPDDLINGMGDKVALCHALISQDSEEDALGVLQKWLTTGKYPKDPAGNPSNTEDQNTVELK